MSTSPSTAGQREATLRTIRENPRAQVVIIGGGINGISTFRDLALQGVDVLLVERGDFASGASAASSHMVHGGIRYLENGEFRLVHESVVERNDLLKTAPHFVKPLKTTVPMYHFWSGLFQAPFKFLFGRSGKPVERGAAMIKIGLTIYDLFVGPGRRTPWHRFHGHTASLRELPRLNPRVKYTATYFDASMHDPERLALDVLIDGLESNRSAHALNYVEAIGFTGTGVTLRDRETGETFTVEADAVVNASGPWADLTNDALGKATRFMGGTKGSHIVLDNPELVAATGGREIFFEHSDGRIVLIYPLKGRVMVGTTDIAADPAEPARCTEEEVDYFLDLITDVFPDIAVSRDQIVYRFSGIRPLPASDASSTGQISRDYRLVVDQSRGIPVTTLVGGKWTTFRALGETLSDLVLDQIGVPRAVTTKHRAIGGGRDFPMTPRARGVWLRSRIPGSGTRGNVLLGRYGTRAAAVWDTIEAEHDEALAGDRLSTRELAWMVDHEHIVHLADVILRRTDLAFTGSVTPELLARVADTLAPLLGWDADRVAEEIDDTVTQLREAHGVTLVAETADV
ncbi:glycerol-3-phosphate dehydrogenase [Microbacterium sorbitolivorans]|uniref:Glycerol-3-phosphate dehydrogenase/oxidase n=1 Tax=Microbacterium sorbitolivorans TaxID=1867410 RepID=A0A367Y8B7_9MICO|nr:glycerol-3-phosphate dehydrogenase/oxidase [Microbacterium sorbitolivorans]RCK61850.1 glycerol-3-phosphate dehydrogenase/oxidase [Microbacterium sorbitolivorans]GGF45157.1 glycerol-3-phosphate dehydrogenase [Microbacterium sorbitolivorans]